VFITGPQTLLQSIPATGIVNKHADALMFGAREKFRETAEMSLSAPEFGGRTLKCPRTISIADY
jgi:hypothetical protein